MLSYQLGQPVKRVRQDSDDVRPKHRFYLAGHDRGQRNELNEGYLERRKKKERKAQELRYYAHTVNIALSCSVRNCSETGRKEVEAPE